LAALVHPASLSGTEGAEQPQGAGSDGSTIRGGTWIFDAYFFESTSADQQRRSYKLLDGEKVHVTVESLIQEADLEFDRDGMHDRILGDLSHLKIMRHNFSNVVT
jgi:hypothetical protein